MSRYYLSFANIFGKESEMLQIQVVDQFISAKASSPSILLRHQYLLMDFIMSNILHPKFNPSITYDLTNITQKEVHECALALHNMDVGAKSMEEVANRTVRYLYERLVDQQDGNRACALVRFFKTHAYGELNEKL